MVFEYPITRNFPWRYFPHYTVFFMVVVMALVTLFNAAAVGYELVPTYSDTFNSSHRYWWSRVNNVASFKKNPQCESRRLDNRDLFSTKLGIFQYTVDSLLERNGDSSRSVTTISYNDTDLEDCELYNVVLEINNPERTSRLSARLTCTTEIARLNVSTVLVVSLSSNKDTMLSRYLSDELFFPFGQGNPTLFPIVSTLLGFSLDFYHTVYYRPPGSTAAIPHMRYWEFTSCSRANCQPYDPEPVHAFRSFIDGSTNEDLSNEGETNTAWSTIHNLLITFTSAVLIDLGSVSAYNMFKNDTNRHRWISDHFNDSEAVPAEEHWYWDITDTVSLTSPFGRMFLDDPSQFSISLPIPDGEPAKIASNFLCRRWQRKPWTSALISIAAASVSFGFAIWGAYMWLAVCIAKRKRASRNHCSCPRCSDTLEAPDIPLLDTPSSIPWSHKRSFPD